MYTFFKKFTKIFFTNLLILFSFIFLIEIFFGYWFDKDNFGPYMREHRMKNQPTVYKQNGEAYKYSYRRNYHGFRGEDIKPSDIQAIIMGGGLIGLNISLMVFVYLYWLNTDFHSYMTGHPL